jgi:hypothetical protein
MWYRNIKLAEQGVRSPVYQGVNLKDELTKLVKESSRMYDNKIAIDVDILNQKIRSSVLRFFISKVQMTSRDINGSFNQATKILTINPDEDVYKTVQNFNSTFRHELIHGTSPIKAKGYEAKQQLNITQKNLADQLQNSILEKSRKLKEYYENGTFSEDEYNALYKQLKEQFTLELDKIYDMKPNFDPNRNTRGRTTYFKDEEVMAQSEDFKNAFKKENLKEVYNKFYNGDVKKFQTDMRQFVASLPSIKKAWDQIYSESFNSPDYVEKLVEKNFSPDISDGYKRLKSNPNVNPALLADIETTAKTREKANILLKIPGYSFAEKVSSVFGYKIEFIMEDIKDPKWFGTLRNSISNDLIEIEEELGLRPQQKLLKSEQLALQNKKLKDNIFLDSKGNIVLKPEVISNTPPTLNVPVNSPVNAPASNVGYCHNPICDAFNIKEPNAGKFCDECGQAVHSTPKDIDAKRTSPTNKSKTKQLSSQEISKITSKLPQTKTISTPASKNAITSALPIIIKLFKGLGEYLQKNLDKLNNSKAGKVFNFAMLVKDVYFIITTADKISKQVNAGEEVMVKDQYDLGLTIVSLLTDQQTQAILRVIFPPIIVLLNNPQIQAWLAGINISANVLSGAVSVADQLGTMAGTTNKSEGATSGIMNTPGSAQALVMPVFQLREKYGEVYNALIDIEKGLSVPQAISKHIMKDASGGIDPYRLSLLYKFTGNKAKIIAYQNSAAFKKLPAQNQLLYPNANSTYVVSSYKKARDSQELAKQQSRQQSYNRNFGAGGVSSIPVQ